MWSRFWAWTASSRWGCAPVPTPRTPRPSPIRASWAWWRWTAIHTAPGATGCTATPLACSEPRAGSNLLTGRTYVGPALRRFAQKNGEGGTACTCRKSKCFVATSRRASVSPRAINASWIVESGCYRSSPAASSRTITIGGQFRDAFSSVDFRDRFASSSSPRPPTRSRRERTGATARHRRGGRRAHGSPHRTGERGPSMTPASTRPRRDEEVVRAVHHGRRGEAHARLWRRDLHEQGAVLPHAPDLHPLPDAFGLRHRGAHRDHARCDRDHGWRPTDRRHLPLLPQGEYEHAGTKSSPRRCSP